jgi:hypothetical protein
MNSWHKECSQELEGLLVYKICLKKNNYTSLVLQNMNCLILGETLQMLQILVKYLGVVKLHVGLYEVCIIV